MTRFGVAALAVCTPAMSYANEPSETFIALSPDRETSDQPSTSPLIKLDTSEILRRDVADLALEPVNPSVTNRKLNAVNMDGFLKTKVKLGSIGNGEDILEMTRSRQGRGLYPRTRYTDPLTPQAGFAVMKSF